MSSGQWEVVGKNKKNQNGKVKGGKDDGSKTQKNGPKLEDILPNSQIKTLYAGMVVENGTKPPKDKKKEGEKKAKKQTDKKGEAAKPKPPKTIEAAAQAIDQEELSNIIASNKARFSNAPLVWLKEISIFLNSKLQIEVEDPTFPNQRPQYPVSVVTKDIRKLLESVFESAGKANCQIFYDLTLTSLANDMSRGLSVNGHRILLQMLAQQYPEFCVSSVAKSTNIRNSYQNRPPIGLSLLWAFGQGGNNDFSVGLQAWQELFLPIVDLKNYTKYIISYLEKLIDRHIDMDSATVSQDKFFTFLEAVNSKRNSLSKDQSSDLIKQLSKVKDIYFARSNNKLQVTFNQLMKKLPSQYLGRDYLDPYNEVIVQSLVDCLVRDDSCNATWRQLFQRCSKQSATLLDYIDNNWAELSLKLKKKSLKATVLQYQEVCGDALKGKKKDEVAVSANKTCQAILSRMTSTRRFPWLWASFFLFISIVGLISYDVSQAGGNFPKSATGKLLNDLGLLEQSQAAWRKSLSTSARGYLWLETNGPVYYTQAVEYSKPYAQLAKDLAIVGVNKAGALYGNIREYVVDKTPVVATKIEEYAPGLIDNVLGFSTKSWSTLKKYSGDYYELTSDYLKTKVFVGDWAPEVLQNKTQSALNVTRGHVATYYVWFKEQVHVYSKIP